MYRAVLKREWSLHPTLVLIAVAVLLPWLGYALKGPNHLAVDQAPLLLLMTSFLGVAALWLVQEEFWLGLLCAWMIPQIWWHPTGLAFEEVEAVTLGAISLMLFRRLPAQHRHYAMQALVWAGVIQACLGIAQGFGYEWFWDKWYGPVGMMGNPGYLGMYLALVAPLAPLWLLPLFVLGIFMTGTLTAFAALCVGMAVQDTKWAHVPLGTGIAFFGIWLWYHDLHSLASRWDIWLLVWQQQAWWTWLIGNGPGSWILEVPKLQSASGLWPDAILMQAHNEYIQFLYEVGFAGWALLGMWLFRRQGLWRTEVRGSLAACAILSLTYFPWHIATTAAISVVIVGLGLGELEARTGAAHGLDESTSSPQTAVPLLSP